MFTEISSNACINKMKFLFISQSFLLLIKIVLGIYNCIYNMVCLSEECNMLNTVIDFLYVKLVGSEI